ncbi:type ISP restriction/modification enzyme [Sandaracinus amylolyticus]|uniref:site-specific DNA-methyltransferase (adenine-specific) n=1 Tax=Sandaracinus amylolyticus TaxID=927083 RepID=A0A0F6W4X7_9BACT|nr:type ISP restriction/modification enzyme [Sandaracinus amylolyticus]AKF07587.1 putative helicase [Sandaracinus amylolyticus]
MRLVERVEASARERDATLDRETARTRGVVHTPAAIARFVAHAADLALREHLARPDGIASDDVVLVDPATGPGVFLAALIEHGIASRARPRACVGLDVDGDAISRADAIVGAAARDLEWPLRLAQGDALASLAPVRELEDDDVVRVVVGNPPWAARSANRDARLTEALLDDFRRDDTGAPLAERKIGVLSDDYVRFVRWSVELVRRARRGGVIALVTNASFLDGPVHRAMRAALARWLDRIDVIDLGGSSLIARARGIDDENVFGVRPSVAITIGVRAPVRRGATALRIARVEGTRDEKLDALSRRALRWESHDPTGTWRLARGGPAPATYRTWPSLDAWMPFHREGLQTNRDELVIARDRDALLASLETFARGGARRATPHWDPERARLVARELLRDPDPHVRRIAYRPFDERVALVHPALCHRPRPELARALDASGLALISARKDRGQLPWACFGAARVLPDNCWLSTRSSCRARAFPLCDPEGAPNLDRDLARRAEDASGAALDARTFATWALAWMASQPYRDRCDDALRTDYPRIPAPRDGTELARIARLGEAIVRALIEPATPLAITVHEAPPGRARVLEDEGTIERGGARWIEGVPPRALRLVIGHHGALACIGDDPAAILGALDAAARAVDEASRAIAELDVLHDA